MSTIELSKSNALFFQYGYSPFMCNDTLKKVVSRFLLQNVKLKSQKMAQGVGLHNHQTVLLQPRLKCPGNPTLRLQETLVCFSNYICQTDIKGGFDKVFNPNMKVVRIY